MLLGVCRGKFAVLTYVSPNTTEFHTLRKFWPPKFLSTAMIILGCDSCVQPTGKINKSKESFWRDPPRVSNKRRQFYASPFKMGTGKYPFGRSHFNSLTRMQCFSDVSHSTPILWKRQNKKSFRKDQPKVSHAVGLTFHPLD